ILVRDSEDLLAVSAWSTVGVADILPPVLTDLNPKRVGGGGNFTLRFGQYDNIGMTGVRMTVLVDGLESAVIHASPPFYEVLEFVVKVPPDSSELRYKLMGWDEADNLAELRGSMEVVDVTPPTIIDLTTGDPHTGASFELSFHYRDNLGITDGFMEWKLDTGKRGNETRLSDRLVIPEIENEALELLYRVGAVDDAGNWNIIERVLQVMDGTPPSIEVEHGDPYTSDELVVRLISHDNRKVEAQYLYYIIDDAPFQPAAGNVNGNYSIDVPADAAKLTLIAAAKDSSGLVTYVNSTMEVLDGTPPVIIGSGIDTGKDGSIIFSLTASDNRGITSAFVIVRDKDGIIFNLTLARLMDGSYETVYRNGDLEGSIEATFHAADGSGNTAVAGPTSFEIRSPGEKGSGATIIVAVVVLALVLIALALLNLMYIRRSDGSAFPVGVLESSGASVADMDFMEE
ncbi:MAG: hypothetical protein ACMUHY_02770, partial [Thermoplasmatota archaeon]